MIFFFLHAYVNDFHNLFLHHLPEDQHVANLFAVPWVSLSCSFIREKCHFLSSNLCQVFQSPWLIKYYQEWFCNVIWQLPPSLWVHLVRAHGSMNVVKYYWRSLTWSFSTMGTSTLLCTFPWVSVTWGFCPLLSSGTTNKDWSLQNFLSMRKNLRVRRRLKSSRSDSYPNAEICIKW